MTTAEDRTEEETVTTPDTEAVEAPVETPVAAEAPVATRPAGRPVIAGKPTQTVGRRKQAIVRVRLMPGSGQFKLNGRSLEEYFPHLMDGL